MKRYRKYIDAEADMFQEICYYPDFITPNTFEKLSTGFILANGLFNRNKRSNYDYADAFFEWMLTGERQLSNKLISINPWVQRFVDTTGLPSNFSASYGWKIKDQLNAVLKELKANPFSRRAYINILLPEDKILLEVKSTHEYPCTIGLQFLIRNEELVLIVNMRSNNVYSVMPYDVYIFTRLQEHIANELRIRPGEYRHQINSAHIFKGDVRRIKETVTKKSHI